MGAATTNQAAPLFILGQWWEQLPPTRRRHFLHWDNDGSSYHQLGGATFYTGTMMGAATTTRWRHFFPWDNDGSSYHQLGSATLYIGTIIFNGSSWQVISLIYHLPAAQRRVYQHDVVIHKQNFVDPNFAEIHRQSIKNLWSWNQKNQIYAKKRSQNWCKSYNFLMWRDLCIRIDGQWCTECIHENINVKMTENGCNNLGHLICTLPSFGGFVPPVMRLVFCKLQSR